MQGGNFTKCKPNIFMSATQEIQQHLLLRGASLKPPLLFWVWAWLLIFCFSLFNHYFLIQIAIRSQKWKWEILYSKCFVSKISSQFVLYDILCSGLNQSKNSNIWFDQHLPKSFQCKLFNQSNKSTRKHNGKLKKWSNLGDRWWRKSICEERESNSYKYCPFYPGKVYNKV